MKPDISHNLRKLRVKKGVTQEQVAEAFDVSPQAVSRWERGLSYPDITLLPGLAIFYDTSVDEIVGMGEIRKKESLNRIHGEINRLVSAGDTDKAVELIRESLKTYPNDSGLLMSLSETLAHRSNEAEVAWEAIDIAERVLRSEDISMKAKSTTAANLLFLYLRTDMHGKAAELVRSLPHIWESREMLMPELAAGDDYVRELRECITKVLVFLCAKIEAAPGRERGATPEYVQLGVNFEPKLSTEEMLERIREFMLHGA